jgi:hypothetical protein
LVNRSTDINPIGTVICPKQKQSARLPLDINRSTDVARSGDNIIDPIGMRAKEVISFSASQCSS